MNEKTVSELEAELKRAVTIVGASDIFATDTQTVYRAIRSGKLQAFKIFGRLMVSQSEIERYLAESLKPINVPTKSAAEKGEGRRYER